VHAANQCLAWLTSNGRLQRRVVMEKMTLDADEDTTRRYVEESLYWSCLKSEM
jgi:hypothetical protein